MKTCVLTFIKMTLKYMSQKDVLQFTASILFKIFLGKNKKRGYY